MYNFLKIFIKDYDKLDEIQKRTKVGSLIGLIGIGVNILLVVLKLVAGLLTGAVSIMADAINNFSDAASSVITLVGFKLACKPADKEHPYGHGRIEYIAGLFVAELIVVMGIELLHTSVNKIINPRTIIFSYISILILVVSIFFKLFLSVINGRLGKKFDSTVMIATSKDSLSDVLSTSVVLISLLFSDICGFNLDGYAGAFVAVLVIIAGVSTTKDTISPLLGQAPDYCMVARIRKIVLSEEMVYGFHDLIVHDYGPGRKFVSLHAEIDKNTPLVQAHKCVDEIEQKIASEYNCYISIHVDPVDIEEFKN